jgi:hypothetical protein
MIASLLWMWRRLDAHGCARGAGQRLDGAGLDYERVGGGAFGIVVRSKWSVCDQTPKPGTEAAKVTLGGRPHLPAAGAAHVRGPDLVGTRLVDAENRLARRGARFDVVRLDAAVPPSRATVCEQEPGAGTRATEVTLYAARDCEPAAAPAPAVPLLVDEDLDDAERALEAAGIEYTVEASGPGPIVEELWEVCRQSPAAGRASTVVLYARDDCRS